VVLTIGTVCYLASLPFGYLSYRRHERKDAASAGATAAGAAAQARVHGEAPAVLPAHGEQAADSNRRARLN
jgi:CDP-diacylglycerol--serine O-phosphatidyltransferase